MSGTTFSQLPRELRDMIWSMAAAAQYQYIADRLPKSCKTPFAERQRQTFIGHDNLPTKTERQPLRVYVYDSHNRDKLRVGVNELQALPMKVVNSLPLATVCSEARSRAIDFCRTQVKFVNLHYAVDGPEGPEGPDELSVDGDNFPEDGLAQPTTVMVTTAGFHRREIGPPPFDSAAHLVDVIHRVFKSSQVEQIIFNSWFESYNSLEGIYWPHTAQIRHHEYADPVFTDSQNYHRFTTFMKERSTVFLKEGALHARKKLCNKDPSGLDQVFYHLLKFQEVFNAATHKLPQLRSIEQTLHIYCWDEVLLTRIKATKRDDGALCVNWNEVVIGFKSRFTRSDGN